MQVVLGHARGDLRVGFSASMFGSVNNNDAIAAIRAWSQIFMDEEDISSVPRPQILGSMVEIEAALKSGTLDYVSLTTVEYDYVRNLLPAKTITVGVRSGSLSEKYLLLVSRDSGIESLEDLRGKSLRLITGPRLTLLSAWLDVALMQKGLAPTVAFFGTVKWGETMGKTLLPVFFGQADACVITRSGFDTMTELNPQIGRKLSVIAQSDPLIPTMFCFTRYVDKDIQEKVAREITRWHLTTAGRQCLMIFQTDSIEMHPVSVLSLTLDLLAEHRLLLKKTKKDAGAKKGLEQAVAK